MAKKKNVRVVRETTTYRDTAGNLVISSYCPHCDGMIPKCPECNGTGIVKRLYGSYVSENNSPPVREQKIMHG